MSSSNITHTQTLTCTVSDTHTHAHSHGHTLLHSNTLELVFGFGAEKWTQRANNRMAALLPRCHISVHQSKMTSLLTTAMKSCWLCHSSHTRETQRLRSTRGRRGQHPRPRTPMRYVVCKIDGVFTCSFIESTCATITFIPSTHTHTHTHMHPMLLL